MKKMVLVLSAFALATSLWVLAQETTKPNDMKQDSAKADKMGKAVSVSGKIGDDGKTFVDKDGKTWTIANPEAVKGHEVTLKAHVDANKNEVHIVSLKMGKGEMKETQKKNESQY